MLPFLPVYLVVDCSASMHGAPLEAAAQSVAILLQLLNGGSMGEPDDFGLKLIRVNSWPSDENDFTPPGAFQLPSLIADGLTPVSRTLWRVRAQAQAQAIDDGRAAPLICLFTDGDATDAELVFEWSEAGRGHPSPRLVIIACGATDSSRSYLKSWRAPVLDSARLTEDQLRRVLRP